MLTVLQGGFYADMGRELRTRIEARIQNEKASILLVPEQQTVTAESEYADHLPASAPRFFEVSNFTRLPNRIFRELGGLCEDHSDKTVKALYMWRALTELSPTLSPQYARVSEGNVEKALSAYRELRSLCLDAEMLSDASEQVAEGHPRLSEKLSDLAKITALFHTLHSEKYRDSGDDMLATVKKLSEHPALLADTEIFIDGFTSFTEEQYRVLEALLRQTSVTLTLRIPKLAEDAHEYTEPRAVLDRLKRTARKIGTQIMQKKLDGANDVHPLLQQILPLLWKSNAKIDENCLQNGTNALKIYQCSTPYDMVSFVSQDILRRVQEEGCRYSDFAIVYSKASAAEGLLAVALRKAGIPSTLHTHRDASSFEATKLIDCAYSAISSSFRRSDLLAYAKCGLSGLSRDEVCALELYTEKWQIEGHGFTSEVLWSMNPLGYGAEENEQTAKTLCMLNEARERLMRPLLALKDDTAAAKTVSDHTRAIFRLLSELCVEEGLRARAETLRRFGENEAAEENERLFSVICELLDRLVDVMGDFKADEKVFRSLLGILFRSVELGHIPPLYDCVCAGTADLIRPADIKHVYLLGVNAGEFPMNPSDSGALTTADKECMQSLGFPIEASRDVQSARELFSFSRAFAMGRESVSLLYTEKNTSFAKTPPADLIARLTVMSDQRLLPESIDGMDASRRIYAPQAALESFDRLTGDERAALSTALSETGHADALRIMERQLANNTLQLSADTAAALYEGTMALSQSRLDTYVQCPFMHFCTYTLGLAEQRRAELNHLSIGTFLHAILERFLSEIKAEGIAHASITAEQRHERVQRIAKEESERLLRCGGTRAKRETLQIRRLTRAAEVMAESLCREFSKEGGFSPAFFELRIGTPGGPRAPMLQTEGGPACIYGTIDRVDALRAGDDVYLRVVDYKTGKKAFSPSDLAKGENMQMFLYLRSLTEAPPPAFKEALGIPPEGRVIPAGAIYMNALTEDENLPSPPEGERSITMADSRTGMILNDPISIGGMHPDFLPIKYKKDGSPTAATRGNLYTPEGWEQMMQSLTATVEGIASRMRMGSIPAAPKKRGSINPCERCEYKAVCRSCKE